MPLPSEAGYMLVSRVLNATALLRDVRRSAKMKAPWVDGLHCDHKGGAPVGVEIVGIASETWGSGRGWISRVSQYIF
jgi:hypothetical protein